MTKTRASLYDEYHKVFSKIKKESRQQLAIERKIIGILSELSKMNYWSKKIENEGKSEKIEKFNDKYIKLIIKLRELYEDLNKK